MHRRGNRLGLAGTCPAIAAVALSFLAAVAQGQNAPQYRYDPTWPQLPLPNGWTFQGITGMYVDDDNVIWVLQRPRDFDRDATQDYASRNPPSARCCNKPPAVMAFDVDGRLLHAWGDPETVPGWPRSEHTILVDREGFVWIGGATPGDTLLKFTKDGMLAGEFGKRGPMVEAREQSQNNQQTEVLMRGVAAAELDEAAREIYIADGYLNRRVLVYDLDSGAFKRGWGAYGKPLAEISNAPSPPYDPNAEPRGDFQGSVHAVRLVAARRVGQGVGAVEHEAVVRPGRRARHGAREDAVGLACEGMLGADGVEPHRHPLRARRPQREAHPACDRPGAARLDPGRAHAPAPAPSTSRRPRSGIATQSGRLPSS